MATIAEILSARISKAGKSKTYVASKLGVTEKTIENYMRGIREPDATTLVKLSQILEFSLNELSEQSVPRATFSDSKGPAFLAGQLSTKDEVIKTKEEVLAEKEARRLEAERTAEYLKEQLAKEKADKDKLFAALEKAQDILIKSTERLDANLIESLEHLRNLELKANIIVQQIEGLPAVHEIMIPVEKKKVAASASKGGKSSGAHKKDDV